jgi:hypothetical protein
VNRPQQKAYSKQPLFKKSGAKILLCWVMGIVGANAHDPES